MIGKRYVSAVLLAVLAIFTAPSARADINLLPDTTNNIPAAVLSRDYEQVKGLVVKGFNINALDAEGRSGLILAASIGSAPMAKLLIDNGARVGIADKTGN